MNCISNRLIVLLAASSLAFFFSVVLSTSETDTEGTRVEHHSRQISYRDADFTIEIIPGPNNTYGYDIAREGRILIHQPHIPALPACQGFRTMEDANKVAEFVIGKMRQGFFPPAVSIEELRSLELL